MKTVTQAFRDAQLSKAAFPVRDVYYKRRYWVESSKAFTWESSWTLLPEDQIVSVGAITAKLDTERMNEFKVSNLTIVVKNDMNQWGLGNQAGKFGKDAASPIHGYEAYWTKFQVKAGFTLSDGTNEVIALFTGLSTEFSSDTSGQMQITVEGLESLLINADAENVSTTVTAETIGTGNGVTKAFTTANPGVGIVDEVSVAGIAKKAGKDYQVSNLNEPTLGATITFETAPASGTIRCTYRYWKQSQKIEDMVGDLLTEAGIAEVNQNVDPVLFTNTISRYFEQTSQADWLAGTFSDTEAATSPGDVCLVSHYWDSDLLDDFSDGNYSANPAWTVVSGAGWSAASGQLVTTATAGSIYTASTRAFGKWSFYFAGAMSPGNDVYIAFMAGGIISTFPDCLYQCGTNGYAIRIEWSTRGTGTPQYWISLVRLNASGFQTTLAGPISMGTTTPVPMAFTVKRYPTGYMIVTLNGGTILSATDTTYYASNYFAIQCVDSGYAYNATFDSISIPTSFPGAYTGYHISKTLDASATVSAYGKLTSTVEENGGTFAYYTRTSDDGLSWDSWVSVSGNGQIQSAVKRYIQVKAVLTCPVSPYNNPKLKSYTVSYVSSEALVSIAKFTGKSVYDAIQVLGGFCNYEYGFDAEENFFFRSKSVDKNVDDEFRWDTNVLHDGVSSFQSGFDKVYSEVEATYGEYTSLVKGDDQTPAGEKARFARRRLSIDGGDVLIAPDADIATGVAAAVFADVRRPKRRCKVKTKFWPQVELSDTVTLTYKTYQPSRPWGLGDTQQQLGDVDLQLFGSGNQIADEMLCKVVGYRHDLEGRTSEFDLEEVL